MTGRNIQLISSIVFASTILSACGGGGGSSPSTPSDAEATAPSVANSNSTTGSSNSTPNSSPTTPSNPTASTPFNKQQCAAAWGSSNANSAWVYPDANGLLNYKPLNTNGDHIMDFSSAGYMGGGVSLPLPPATVTISPIGNGGDDTANIQQAINTVSALPPNSNGIRGVVLLKAGSYNVQSTLNIAASGVILRGSGSGSNGTIINNTNPTQNGTTTAVASPGAGGQTLLSVLGNGNYTIVSSSTTNITDSYVPSGANTLTLSSTGNFQVGSQIAIQRPITSAWVKFMGMDNLGAGNTWLPVGTNTTWLRTITGINGQQITLDAPLSDSLDSTYLNPPGGTVSLYTLSNPLQQVGIEHIRFVGVPRTMYTNNNMLMMDNAINSWVQDVVGDNFTSGVTLGKGVSRMTLTSVALTHENNNANVPCLGAKFAEFSLYGSQILIDKSSSTGAAASFYFATLSRAPGPNVLLNFQGTPDTVCSMSSIQPHERWATGLLIDGAQLAPNKNGNSSVAGSIDFANRGSAGSGQGWSVGWSVVWNAVASFNIQQPPGSTNWNIGGVGNIAAQTTEPAGIVDSPNVPVAPKSLYLAQMCQRAGPQALSNIGY